MADSKTSSEGLKELLTPFYQRAAEAEERLSKLEAVAPKRKVIQQTSEEASKKVQELELKLGEVTAELAAEKEKVAKLTADNNKKDYRIIHLVQSLKEADLKLEKSGLANWQK